MGRRFRRQHVVKAFVVDFCCPSDWLVVEVGGSVHESLEARTEDDWRTGRLNELGFRVLRVSNEDVLRHPDVVLAHISEMLAPVRRR